MVTGCVAVGRDGSRLGKGGGFSDLELAVAAAAGLVDEHHGGPTTVHPEQIVPDGAIPVVAHDIHLDLIVTEEEVTRCRAAVALDPPELDWDQLTAEKVAAIPSLPVSRAGRAGHPLELDLDHARVGLVLRSPGRSAGSPNGGRRPALVVPLDHPQAGLGRRSAPRPPSARPIRASATPRWRWLDGPRDVRVTMPPAVR